jgi:hypothetical protein
MSWGPFVFCTERVSIWSAWRFGGNSIRDLGNVQNGNSPAVRIRLIDRYSKYL